LIKQSKGEYTIIDRINKGERMINDFFAADWWKQIYLNNQLENYGKAMLAFLGYLILFSVIQKLLLKRFAIIAERTPSSIDDVVLRTIETLKPPFYTFLAFYLAVDFVTIGEVLKKIIYTILIAWIVYQVILVVEVMIDFVIARRISGGKEKEAKLIKDILRKVSKAIIWVFGVLFILSNLGINVNSLIAGLGIGGIAIALALQNILRDLFSSFAIYFDKPFVIGDYIAVGEDEGFVKEIGIKTTRIKATQGEEIVISNQELTSTKIRNFSRLTERRVIYCFKIDSGTSEKKLGEMTRIAKKIFEKVDLARFEYLHLINFNKESYDYELSYLIQSDKYQKFLEIRESVLQGLVSQLKESSIKIV